MSSEEQEIEKVRIAHRGACPFHKGHADFYFIIGVFFGLLVGLIVNLAWFEIVTSHYTNEMIEHGAGYWSNDQQWIWRQ